VRGQHQEGQGCGQENQTQARRVGHQVTQKILLLLQQQPLD
jgi:hypothetical protein